LSAEKNEDVDFEYQDENIKLFIKDDSLNVDNNSLNINARTMGWWYPSLFRSLFRQKEASV